MDKVQLLFFVTMAWERTEKANESSSNKALSVIQSLKI